MELASVRRLRYVLLAIVCVLLTITISYFNPGILPHRVRQMTIQYQQVQPYRPPVPVSKHPNPLKLQPQPAQQPPSKSLSIGPTSTPHRKLNIVNYSDYPMMNDIECVPLRSAVRASKICIHPVAADHFVSGLLKRSGTWEAHIVNSVKNQLQRCQDCQFIDIGANLGVFALSVASMGRKVIAVEPLKANLVRLTKAIQLNGMQQTITLVYNAVSNVYENVSMWQPRDNAGGTHTASINITNFDKKIFDKASDPPIPTIKMDDLTQVIDFKKAVMKIDIEGYEPKAFGAAEKLFDAVDVRYIYMEWGGKQNSEKNYVQPMLDFMSRRGFVPYDNNLARSLNAANTALKFERTKGWPWDIVWVRKS